MAAGGMAAHHDALAEPLPEIQARGLRLLDDLSDRDLRSEIVAGHRDGDAVGVHAARHLAEARRFERAPVAAVNEQRERAASPPPFGLNRSMVWRGRGAVLQADLGAAFFRRPRRDRPRRRAPSARKSADAPAPARGCCIRPRSRSPLQSPRMCQAEWSKAGRWARRKASCLFRPVSAALETAIMKVDGKPTRTIWLEADGWSVGIIDQTVLPHRFATLRLTTLDDMARAIKTMQVRGAPLIGAAAAYGLCLALRADASDEGIERAYALLHATRPTAINLKWALDEMVAAVRNQPREARVAAAYRRAAEIADEDVAIQKAIGRHGLKLIEDDRRAKARRAGQRADPLQRRLARRRRFRHRRRRRSITAHDKGIADPCLGRRDAAAQSGRLAHRLGARPARRAAHRDRRQHRRPSDAARHGRHGDRRHRPRHRAGRRLQQDRHLSEGARREGQRRAVLCGAAVDRPSTSRCRTACRKSRSSSAAPRSSRP